MADPILFTLTPPTDANVTFMGTKPKKIRNVDFHSSANHDELTAFFAHMECLVDEDREAAGKTFHPLKFSKKVNINTPFFAECCHAGLTIPKISFHFFHSLQEDGDDVNFATLELEQATVLSQVLRMYDTTAPHNPEKGVYSTKSKPYTEEISLAGQVVRWKYHRNAEPLAANFATEYRV